MNHSKWITIAPDDSTIVEFCYYDISTLIFKRGESNEIQSVEIDMKNGTNWSYTGASARSFYKQWETIKEGNSWKF